MKALLGFALLLTTTLTAQAGPFVSGGVPPAPRAVVIQTEVNDGQYDQEGLDIALDLAAQYLKSDRLAAITQRAEAQSSDRKYLCIEFKRYDEAFAASKKFQQALENHPSVQVVENGFCR